MDSTQVYVSAVAFAAVFIMLTVLAGLMTLLTRIFPGKVVTKKPRRPAAAAAAAQPIDDPQLVAAITQAVNQTIPGARISQMKEIK